MKRNAQHLRPAGISAWQRVAFVMLFLLSALAAINGNKAYAVPPPAGTSIGNQASATYADALGNAQTPVTSNTVVTLVAQIASFTLTADQIKTVAPGSTVYFPHTLTNTGNGTDTFDLSVANRNDAPNNTFDFSSVAIYIDANGDGVPDNATAIVDPVILAAGAQFKFVAVGVVPGGAASNQNDTLRVTALGNVAAAGILYTPAPAAFNTDRATVTGNAVINVTKSMSSLSGADNSGPYTVTLTYTNGGNATATAVDIGDVLVPGLTYVAGSGKWSVTGATVLTDASNADAQGTTPNTVIYDFGISTAGKVRAVINQVAPGATGTITFNVTVPAGFAPGILNNTATVAYNDGSGTIIGPVNSNTVAFTVLQRAAVELDDVGSVANGLAGNLVADADPIADIVGVAIAPQGATVQFDNVVHNNGNGPDSFDITMSGSTFPAGTSFQIYGADGVTPMVDTNGNSIPDTGAVPAGGTYHVIVKAILPSGASGNNGGAGFVVTKTARSFFDPINQFDTVTDKLAAITANTVDLTNNSWRSDVLPAGGTASAATVTTTGFGPGTATVITTKPTNPGTSTTFRLYVNNTSTTNDNYNLSVVAPAPLPAGWTVVFMNDGGAGDCSTTGATITNTGIVSPDSSRLVCAVVSVPATAPAGTTNFTFRAGSVASGAFDTKVDAVTVNTIHNVVLTPNSTGQAFPGGFVTYIHTLTNNGNVTETITFPGTFLTNDAVGWASVLYQDTGSTPGALDATDPAVIGTTTITLAPGASVTLFDKVTAPLTATAGQTNTTTITVTYNGGASTTVATDITTVITGVLTLVKEQALDVTCDGIADGAFSNGSITAKPGECVRYRITASNNGTANVTSVVVSDTTPANTLYNTGAACPASGTAVAAATVGTVATTPAVGANCTAAVGISATIGTLTPSQSAVVTFGVEVNK